MRTPIMQNANWSALAEIKIVEKISMNTDMQMTTMAESEE